MFHLQRLVPHQPPLTQAGCIGLRPPNPHREPGIKRGPGCCQADGAVLAELIHTSVGSATIRTFPCCQCVGDHALHREQDKECEAGLDVGIQPSEVVGDIYIYFTRSGREGCAVRPCAV